MFPIYIATALLIALIIGINVQQHIINVRFNRELAERNPEIYNRLLAAKLEK